MKNKTLQKILTILSLLLFISSTVEARVLDIVLKQKKAVVTIYIENKDSEMIFLGTGFIVAPDGVIATNYHVISKCIEEKDNTLSIKMENGAYFFIEKVISFDKDNDIALFKVEGKKLQLPTVKLATTYKSKLGDSVVVIGSPKGLETTVSNGIISNVHEKDELVQITAPISPGSSGSPVFNSKGEVIGVVEGLIESGQNLNFAVSVNHVASLLNEYKRPKKTVTSISSPDASAPIPIDPPPTSEATDKLKKAKIEVKKNPDSAKAHHNLGLCYAELGEYREASEAFKQAIRIEPDYAEACNNLGFSYIELKMYKEAIEAFKQSIRIKPVLAEPHLGLGIVYITVNDRGSALEEYKILKDLNPEMADDFFGIIYK